MPEKLVYVRPLELKDEIMSRNWLNDYGSYNHMPDPYVKIDGCTFAEIARKGTPDYIEYRMLAITENDVDKYYPAYIYWYADGGLMVLFGYDANLMEFYLIGCEHNFDEIYAKGAHDLTCKKCGYKDIVYDEDLVGLGVA